MASSNGRVGPWSSIDVCIEGEPKAKDGLRKRRGQLEAIVAPLITSKKTGDEIQFRGNRRYLIKPLLGDDKKQFLAVLALQHLYAIEAAWKAGDIDKVVRAAVGFATCDHDRQLMEWAGIDSVGAAAFRVRQLRIRSEGGKVAAAKHRKRTPENERLAREVFASFHQGKVTKDAAYTRTLHHLAAKHQIKMSRTTLQSILKSPTA